MKPPCPGMHVHGNLRRPRARPHAVGACNVPGPPGNWQKQLSGIFMSRCGKQPPAQGAARVTLC
ncbi:hypothetical protein DB31_6196 [Hyalangium minutum]|uniref:Uncharacterized protein n=1 Tax=Hyalangium minutum TaxID=394096 RepID=A0A085VTY6_9BACT|nr:hypothetical protein DB31_6196 [Hyalangium minutum]